MKNYRLKYINLFLFLLIGIDILAGTFLRKNFNKITFEKYGLINKSLQSSSDILILGSSRAQNHYNAEIISENTHLSCSNSGVAGFGLFLSYAILAERIQIKKSKIVLVDISPNVLVDNLAFNKLNALMPYYKDYDYFKEIIELNPKFSFVETLSSLYIYNSTLYDYLRSTADKKKENVVSALKGEINVKNFVPYNLTTEKVNPDKIVYLKKIIELCKNNDIELIGIISPTYLKFDSDDKIINQLKDIFNKSSYKLIDYSSFKTMYQNPVYFYDQLHMNEKGMINFSNDISKIINKIDLSHQQKNKDY